MSDTQIAQDREIRLDSLTAELTSAIYPLLLRRSPQEPWVKVELGLWRALGETVKRWAKQFPAAASADELEAWREAFMVEVTESAFHVALKNGIKGPFLEVELCVYRAVRLVMRRHSRANE